ncbi:MAG TPA: hypothetical protein VLC46_06965 [Thermoanaerobaculia bacterium]|nr:hypothetical protein [Thermoanaerobaculia bacterium]
MTKTPAGTRACDAETPFADGQIAAIARVNELIVVTVNDADFERFEGLLTLTWR